MKESLTHLPPSWLRPPTPIPRTPLNPLPLSLSLSLSHRLRLLSWLLLLLLAAACQVACRQTKSSLTLQSLYIYGVPSGPPRPRPLFVFLPLAPFQATPLRGTDPHIDRGANPLCWKGCRRLRRYDPDGLGVSKLTRMKVGLLVYTAAWRIPACVCVCVR